MFPIAPRFRISVALALACLAFLPASGQATPVQTTGTVVEPNVYPPALPTRKGPKPPALAFRLLGEVGLPGPLPQTAPRLAGDEIEIDTAGGLATAPPLPGATATMTPLARTASPEVATEPSPWVLSSDGKYRYRTLPKGRLEAEKRSRFADSGWKRKWSIRLPAATLAAPTVFDRLVCIASLADMVICLRSDNGHRLWATDVEDRISRPLVLWEGEVTEPGTGGAPPRTTLERLLLVSPDSGGSIVALDTYDGARRAVYELPATSGRLVSEPVVTPAGTVAVPRQGYQETEAALALLALVVAPKELAKPANPVPYNDPAPATTTPAAGSGR